MAENEPTVAGLWFARHGRTAWLVFACDRHAVERPEIVEACAAGGTGQR